MNNIGNFINFCDDVEIAEESRLSDFIKQRRNEFKDNKTKEPNLEIYRNLESKYKPMLFKIAREYINEFNKNANKLSNGRYKLDNKIKYDKIVELYEIVVSINLNILSGDKNPLWNDYNLSKCIDNTEEILWNKYDKETNDIELMFEFDKTGVVIDIRFRDKLVIRRTYNE